MPLRGLRILGALMAMWLWAWAGAVGAVEVAYLYRVESSVMDQTPATRSKASVDGLRLLVIRLTGNPAAVELPPIKDALGHAGDWVQSFGFREPTAEERAMSPGFYRLQLDFEPSAVNRLLNDAGLPLWGRERPKTLLWLVDDTAQAGAIALATGDTPFLKHIRFLARQKALPVDLPKGGPSEAAMVSAADIDPIAVEPLGAASVAYDADAILAVHVFAGPDGGIVARAGLISGESADTWDVSAAKAEQLIPGLLDGLAQRLAAKYAVVADKDADAGVALEVSNVQTLADYGQLLRYVRSLSQVRRLDVVAIERDRLSLRIAVNGGIGALSRLLELGHHLQPIQGSDSEGAVAQYQWMP